MTGSRSYLFAPRDRQSARSDFASDGLLGEAGDQRLPLLPFFGIPVLFLEPP
jgi:hypothetical protein